MTNAFEEFFELPNCKYTGNRFAKKEVIDNKKRRIKLIHVFEFEYVGKMLDTCPLCSSKLHKHGTRKLELTDTPAGGKPAEVHITYSRMRCPNDECKTKDGKKFMWTPEVVDLDCGHKMTYRAFKDIAQKSLRNTFNEVTNDYALAENTIKNVFIDFTNVYKEKLRFKTPAFLGIDEIKIPKIGEVTVITDLEHRTVYDMFPHRDQTNLTIYFSQLPDPETVLWVCSDMYRPFEKSIRQALPNATWVIDHFHVVAKANEALDSVRKTLQESMSKKDRIDTKRGLAYTLKTRRRDLSTEEAEKIRLARLDPKKKIFAELYDLKEAFFDIYDENKTSKENAKKAFADWEKSIPEDPLFDKFREVADTVHNHYDQIFNYWDCPIAISNGYTECTNRLIREKNLKGRGYTFDILRSRTLYRRTNIENALEHGLLYGPSIPETGPVFFMESTEEDAEDEEDWDDEEDFPTRNRATAAEEDDE